MAGKGGGGAWKVAYADFVTAMMAFFLVMWLTAQNQEVKRSVADYFSDPIGSLDGSGKKRASRAGSTFDYVQPGTVPLQERVANGKGRHSHSTARNHSPTTKMVAEWIHSDEKTSDYWHKQATDQREEARWSKDVTEKRMTIETVAAEKLANQLKVEFLNQLPPKTDPLHRNLIVKALSEVNWRELAVDLLGP